MTNSYFLYIRLDSFESMSFLPSKTLFHSFFDVTSTTLTAFESLPQPAFSSTESPKTNIQPIQLLPSHSREATASQDCRDGEVRRARQVREGPAELGVRIWACNITATD